MASLSPILNNLDADDLAVKLFAILRLQDLTGSETVPEKLRQAAEKESDPALKLYLNWLAYPEKSASSVNPAELAELLDHRQPDWPRILRLLLQADRQTSAAIITILRQANLASLPGNLLPVLVGFYSRFGDSQDVALLESWCAHANPAVTILAIEGLSRIQPDSLRNFLFPLLTSESAGIRSRAIRLLYRWHPEEALLQLESMLESDAVDERRAALAHAFFLPFDRIKLALIRFLIRESEPALLVQAGQLLIINPDIEIARSVSTIAVAATAEKAPVIKNILVQQCEFLGRLRLIDEAHDEYAGRLLSEATQTAEQKQLAALSAAVRDRQLQSEADLAGAVNLLKQKFSLDLPAETLQPIVECLAALDPAFLQPHFTALLRIRDIGTQIAALSAMAKISPVTAEKMLEQYLCSASPARRRTGIMVLSRLDPAFARPLLLRTLIQESEKELLDLIGSQLSEPLPRAQLMQLLKQARQTDSCNDRQELLNQLCLNAGITPDEAENRGETCDFSQEEIMLGRAEKTIAGQLQQQACPPQPESVKTEAETRRKSKFVSQYSASPSFARIQLIVEAIASRSLEREELCTLINEEPGELPLFALQSAQVAIEQQSRRSFSPVQTLKNNLAQKVPNWNEIAACLAKMTPEAARLTAPMLQQMRWTSWPETVLPFMLKFIALTARPAFSASVSRLLRHSRSEIRCAAICCLHAINPGDLAEQMTTLTSDKDAEVAATAKKIARQLQTGALSGIKRAYIWLQQLSTFSQAALAGLMIMLLSAFLLAGGPADHSGDSSEQQSSATIAAAADRETVSLHRFEHWRQPAEAGQERAVFGRIEENYPDSLLLKSPALKSYVLIRHDRGVLPLRKNQHFNGRVKIDSVNASRIESTLLPVQENQR